MTALNESARLSSSTGANATLQISSFYLPQISLKATYQRGRLLMNSVFIPETLKARNQKKGGCTMVSDKNPTNGNGGKWTPSRIDAPLEILQIQELSLADLKVLLYLYSRDLGKKKKGKCGQGEKSL